MEGSFLLSRYPVELRIEFETSNACFLIRCQWFVDEVLLHTRERSHDITLSNMLQEL